MPYVTKRTVGARLDFWNIHMSLVWRGMAIHTCNATLREKQGKKQKDKVYNSNTWSYFLNITYSLNHPMKLCTLFAVHHYYVVGGVGWCIKEKGEREEETQVNSTHDFLPPPVHNNNKENLRAFFLRQRQEQVENQSQDKVPQWKLCIQPSIFYSIRWLDSGN